MLRSDIIGRVGGKKRFAQACADARRAASDPNWGTDQETYTFDSKIAHEISDVIWNSKMTLPEKLELVLQFFVEMPCYALLMYLASEYHSFSEQERGRFWSWVRTQLDGDDPAVTSQLAYSLWCDFFENPQTVDEAWRALISPIPSDKTLQTILEVSGPVPFAFKKPLYDSLIREPQWHYSIYRSLLRSQFDVYGNVDQAEAWNILNRLKLPDNTQYLKELKTRLEKDLQAAQLQAAPAKRKKLRDRPGQFSRPDRKSRH